MSGPRLPDIQSRLGLGINMDLRWGEDFLATPEGDRLAEPLVRFLRENAGWYRYLSFVFSARNRNRLQPEDYERILDALFAAAPGIRARALHHTMLNGGTLETYDRDAIYRFTNRLVRRHGFAWIVEDLGLWSFAGKPLPYPLPPLLTPRGLDACIRNTREQQEALDVPLCLEFPGFTEGYSIHVGTMDFFAFFCAVAVETRSPVTLDVGHVLSYQWLRGRTGARMFEGLEALPLAHCFELHLSGCQIRKGKVRDLHHGVLLDEQIALLGFFLEHCPNLRAVTYEDPRYTPGGALIPKSVANFERMRALVAPWALARGEPEQDHADWPRRGAV